MALIVPSLQCADQLNIEKDVRILYHAGARMFHIDIMDGHFVPNLALNFDHIRSLSARFDVLLDIHLMVNNPVDFIDKILPLKPEYIVFHIETTSTPIRLLRYIEDAGLKGGIALNPATLVENCKWVLPYTDQILLMSVEPGFAGQTFMPHTYEKIKMLDNMRRTYGYKYKIGIDGGTTFENGPLCVKYGADLIIAGTTSIFDPNFDLGQTFKKFQNACQNK